VILNTAPRVFLPMPFDRTVTAAATARGCYALLGHPSPTPQKTPSPVFRAPSAATATLVVAAADTVVVDSSLRVSAMLGYIEQGPQAGSRHHGPDGPSRATAPDSHARAPEYSTTQRPGAPPRLPAPQAHSRAVTEQQMQRLLQGGGGGQVCSSEMSQAATAIPAIKTCDEPPVQPGAVSQASLPAAHQPPKQAAAGCHGSIVTPRSSGRAGALRAVDVILHGKVKEVRERAIDSQHRLSPAMSAIIFLYGKVQMRVKNDSSRGNKLCSVY
jgi:hypothetical protein